MRGEFDANQALKLRADSRLLCECLIASARRYTAWRMTRDASDSYSLADRLLAHGSFIGGQEAKAKQLIRGAKLSTGAA